MADKTADQAQKLKKVLDKKKEDLAKSLKKDVKLLLAVSSKPKIDYDLICDISTRIYNNSEAMKTLG